MKFLISLLSVFLCNSIASAISDPQKDIDTRLSHGSVVLPGFFPYVVEIKLSNSFRCVGVIISENWILTTALCIQEAKNAVPAADISVRVGSVSRNAPEPGSYVVSIDRYVIHSGWKIGFINNIALLHVKDPLVFSDIVQAAHLADQSKPIDMALPATVTGWGGDGTNVDPVDMLYYNTNFKLIDEAYCSYEEFTPNSICTNSSSPNPKTCTSDEGGPLLQLDSTIGIVLHGIVSSFGCTTYNNTNYESVVNHRVWIHLVSGV